MAVNHYEILGISADASPEQIKAAYRKLAQQAHPDKEGGDIERFQAIQKSYEVLSDPDRRAHYDRTGSDSEGQSTRDQAMAQLGELFMGMVANGKLFGNLVDKALAEIKNAIKESEALNATLSKKLASAEKQIGRVVSKSGKESIFQVVLDNHIQALKGEQARLANLINLLSAMQEIIEDLEDTKPEENPLIGVLGHHQGRMINTGIVP